MAIYLGANSYSSKGLNVGLNSTGTPLQVNTNLVSGDLIIVNLGLYSGEYNITSGTDTQGNTYTISATTNPIFTGYKTYIYYSIITNPLTSAVDAIGYITGSSGTTQGVNISAYFFRADSGTSFNTSSVLTSVGASVTSTTPSITTASLAINTVLVGTVWLNGPNTDTWTQDTDTLNGSWSNGQAITGPSITYGMTGGNATTNYSYRQQYKITTASGAQTFNPTLGTSRLNATNYFSIEQTGAPTGFTSVDSMGMMGFYGI